MNDNLSAIEFMLFRKYIKDQCGISLGEEKAYLIESRLSKFLVKFGLSNFEELYLKLSQQKNNTLTVEVIDAITTNETLWFRDKTPWEIMESKLLPSYIRDIREGKRSKVRIWSAACSTGQEPYSIAMCIDNYLSQNGIEDITLANFEILATDISRTVLKIAQMGKYDSISMARGLDMRLRDKYFRREGRIWTLDERIKNAVHFKPFNLQNDFTALGSFDMVFCRYVTIYFSEEFTKETFTKVASVLEDNGILFLGNAEVFLNYQGLYEAEYYNKGIFYRVRGRKNENISC